MAKYGTESVGSKYTSTYKVYITRDGKVIAPFHDVPLFSDDSERYVNVINEIPRFEQAKFEISKSAEFNPIVQDIKKGQVRFVKNIYPFFGYQFNYGALPQTWENPERKDVHCDAYGDNDPLDIMDVGTKRKQVGEVYKAKVLGALALLDGGEADWKIVVIDAEDPKAPEINDIADVQRVFPGVLNDALRWFRDYKIPDGSSENKFAMDGNFMDSNFAKKIIKECHEEWKWLIKNGYKGISLKSAENSADCDPDFKIIGEAAPAAEIPDDLKVFSFIKDK